MKDMLLISQPNPAGHVAMIRLADGIQSFVDFVDGSDRLDVTMWLPDLFLLGLAVSHEQKQASLKPGPELEEVAKISLTGSEADFLLMYGHPDSGQVLEVPWAEAAPLISSGIASQITAGVAAEAVKDNMPADASELDGS